MQAHAEKHIDFSKFDPYDTWAWRRLRLIIQHLETVHLQQTRDVDFRYYIAMAGSPHIAEESWQECIRQAAVTRKALINAYRPWLPPEPTENQTTATQSIAERHRALFGLPGEPRYEAMVAELKAAAKRTPAERAALKLQREAAAKRAMLQKGT